jgi:[acyl-carrier-protein] S-malonyltransferase
MGKIAFLFPGQGSQSIGMGVSVAERFPAARDLYDQASHLLGWDLWKVCKEGPEDKLRQTDIAQPALYVTGFAAATVLKDLGVAAEATAGHSIGEYAALAVAGAFDFAQGLSLVRERGRLMHEAGEARPGGMAAVLGLSMEQVQAVCGEASVAGVCVAVNFNSPEQIVIAGERAAVEKANALATQKGAKKVIPLNVSGAFHSPLMAPAAQKMREALSRISFQKAGVPVAMNLDGRLRSEASDILQALGGQLDSAVQWVKTIQTLRAAGYTTFVECGSGRVLSGLLRRIDKEAESFSTESAEAVTEVGEVLSASRRANT